MKNEIIVNLDEIIERAIDLTQKEIKEHPNKILSESDFERMLAKHRRTQSGLLYLFADRLSPIFRNRPPSFISPV